MKEKVGIEFIDYDIAQKIQQEVSAMSLEETKRQLEKLEGISEENLSDEELVLLHHKINVCNLHLEELAQTTQEKEERMFQMSENKKSPLRFLPAILIVVGIAFALFWFVNNLHTCDECGKTFLGDAYCTSSDASAVMCEPCAQEWFNREWGGFLPYTNYKIR